MKTSKKVKFVATLVIIFLMMYLAMFGFHSDDLGIYQVDVNINRAMDARFGIDINGGAYMLFYPEGVELADVTNAEIDSATQVIRRRLDDRNLFDAIVRPDYTNTRIIVEVPARGELTEEFDAGYYIDLIGQTAALTFRDMGDLTGGHDNIFVAESESATTSDENENEEESESATPTDEYGDEDESENGVENGVDDELENLLANMQGNEMPPDEAIILTGADVRNAGTMMGERGESVVTLSLHSEGAERFAEATARLAPTQGIIGIFLDDVMISAPAVQSHITGGEATITAPNQTAAEARQLASLINAGALPFRLVPRQVNATSPLLGRGALQVAIWAGIIALAGVALFMLLYYRFLGLIAAVAITGLIAAMLVIIATTGISLTLPGIAGIILTIGMGTDANIVISERIREELRDGKTLRTALDIGYKRGFTAVFDGNITTIGTAAVLWYFGSGPIRGFATTLMLGVALSFVFNVWFARVISSTCADWKPFKKQWLYIPKRRES